MLCSQCVEEGKKSQLRMQTYDAPKETVDEYWDENGLKHIHKYGNSNIRYVCTNGHTTYPDSDSCVTCGLAWLIQQGKKISLDASVEIVNNKVVAIELPPVLVEETKI